MEKVSPIILDERLVNTDMENKLSKTIGILSNYLAILVFGISGAKNEEDFENKTRGLKLPSVISEYKNVKDIIDKAIKLIHFLNIDKKIDINKTDDIKKIIIEIKNVIKNKETNFFGGNYDFTGLIQNNKFKKFLDLIDSEVRTIH